MHTQSFTHTPIHTHNICIQMYIHVYPCTSTYTCTLLRRESLVCERQNTPPWVPSGRVSAWRGGCIVCSFEFEPHFVSRPTIPEAGRQAGRQGYTTTHSTRARVQTHTGATPSVAAPRRVKLRASLYPCGPSLLC